MIARDPDSSGVRALRLPLWKKILFSLLPTLLAFGVVEGLLALFGVRPLTATRDPFVGFASNIPLYIEHTGADGRVWMTTAPNKLSHFNAQQFREQKPAGTYRIFCMGGSTTYGRPYDDATSFAAWLRELLAVGSPEPKWEVINAGGVSYASYRVAALMEELVQYEPDLFIVYTGQNEFLEQRTYPDMRAASPARLRIAAILAKTLTYSYLHDLLRPQQKPKTERCQLPGEVDAALDHTVGPSSYHRDEALRRQILRHFELNINRMIGLARSCGARIVFIAPASNVKDCSPFKSLHADDLEPGELDTWSVLYERGRSHEKEGHPDRALAAYQAAARIDDRFAELHYRMGNVLFRTDRLAAAANAYARALDEDVCPLRAFGEIPDVLRRTARRLDVPIVDFDLLLRNDCLRNHGHSSPGRQYFLDHVHLTIPATRLLAVAIVKGLIQARIISADASLDDAAIARITRRIESRIDPKAHAAALRNLAKVLNWAGKHYEAGPLALRALETLPNDPECLFLAGAYQKMTGNVEQAIGKYRETIRLRPDYAEAHQLLGAALVEQRRFEEACKHFREVQRINPDDAHAHHMVGAVLSELERFDEALVHYREAARLKPDDANIHYNLAFALAKLGRRKEAIAHYARAIKLDPDDAAAHSNLGKLLLAEGRRDDAIDHFRKALHVDPGCQEAQETLKSLLEARADMP